MKHLFTIAAAVTAMRLAAAQSQPTVAELVAKHIQAKGGAGALHALQSLRLTGKMLVRGDQLELAVSETKKRPASVRQEATMQGLTAVQAYDGAEAWRIMPFQGRKDPEKMSPDDAKELIEDANIDGPLIDWQAKGSTVEYLGREDVEGTQAYKLRVVRKNGDVTVVYLDPDAFLEIREVTQRLEHGAQVETQTDFGDYEKIGGVFFPMSIESGRRGSSEKEKTNFDKGEANVPVDDAIFHFPAGK
jgi:hypothetical protein